MITLPVTLWVSPILGLVRHHGAALGVAGEFLERAGAALGAGLRSAVAQKLVEDLAVHHADIAAIDGHIDFLAGRRHHAGGVDARDDDMARDFEVLDQARRNGAAAGLDPARLVEKQDRMAHPRKIVRSGCA